MPLLPSCKTMVTRRKIKIEVIEANSDRGRGNIDKPARLSFSCKNEISETAIGCLGEYASWQTTSMTQDSDSVPY